MSGQRQFDTATAIDAAMRVFWQHGFHLTSVDDLSQATGLGRGSLYAAFGNKNELFIATLRRYMSLVGAENLAALTSHPGDHRAAIAAFFDVIIQRLAREGNPPGCMGVTTESELPTLPVALQPRVRELMREQALAVRAVFEDARSRKALPANASIDDLAMFVLEVSRSLGSMHRAGAEISAIRGVANVALDAIPVRRKGNRA